MPFSKESVARTLVSTDLKGDGLFDSEHHDIIEKYMGEILSSLPDVSLITVIPSLGELTNDNFWRLLRGVALQTDQHFQARAIIIVVNNSTQAYNLAEGTVHGADDNWAGINSFEGFRRTNIINHYHDNQDHLFIIRSLTDATERVKNGDEIAAVTHDTLKRITNRVILSDCEKEIVALSIHRRVLIFPVDASSEDKALDLSDEDNPISIARNIGGHIAYEIFRRNGNLQRGFIDFLDGDCFPEEGYYKELTSLIEIPTATVIIKPLQIIQLETSKSIGDIKNPEIKLAALIDHVANRHVAPAMNYFLNTTPQKGYFITRIGGPQVVVKATSFRSVGGYWRQNSSQDYTFFRLLSQQPDFKPAHMVDSFVYMSNRGREGSIDGIGMNRNYSESHFSTTYEKIRAANHDHALAMVHILLHSNEELEKSPVADLYRGLRYRFFLEERKKRNDFIARAHEIIDLATSFYQNSSQKKHLSGQDIFDALRDKLHPEEIDYFLLNPIFADCLADVFTLHQKGLGVFPEEIYKDTSPKWVYRFLEKYFPEYFLPPGEGEPSYSRDEVDTKQKQGQRVNARDYTHLIRATYVASTILYG